MKRRGFTLIEILVVIVIISIPLALSLGITGDRVQILKEKYAQEQFISTYNTLFSRNFLTNYYGDAIYKELLIQMKRGEQGFSYSYNTNSDEAIYTGGTNIEGKITVFNMSGWNHYDLEEVDIKFKPYNFGCELSGGSETGNILDMTLLVDDKKKYCYKINSNLCRLEKFDCPNEEN